MKITHKDTFINSSHNGKPVEIALVDTDIKTMIRNGAFLLGPVFQPFIEYNCNHSNHSPNCNNKDILMLLENYVQPSSLDIPIGNRCLIMRDKILPLGRKVQSLLDDKNMVLMEQKQDAQGSFMLLKNQTYLFPCGTLKLKQNQFGTVSPKSSIGRIDLMVRSIFDDCGMYDTINGAGEIWMEVTPRSFNVRVYKFQALAQLMIYETREMTAQDEVHFPKLSTDLSLSFDALGNRLPLKVHRGVLVLSLSVAPNYDIAENNSMSTNDQTRGFVGYEALSTSAVLDLKKTAFYEGNDFFRPIFCNADKSVTLEKDRFYILSTKERVSIPNNLCAEMIPFSHNLGELRVHYAGFFDPGFGFGAEGEIKGACAVLEVRPHETCRVFDGQSICLMEFFHTSCKPEKPYGFVGNHYQSQSGPRLAKYFR